MTQIYGGCTLNSKYHLDVMVFQIRKHFKGLPGKAVFLYIYIYILKAPLKALQEVTAEIQAIKPQCTSRSHLAGNMKTEAGKNGEAHKPSSKYFIFCLEYLYRRRNNTEVSCSFIPSTNFILTSQNHKIIQELRIKQTTNQN